MNKKEKKRNRDLLVAFVAMILLAVFGYWYSTAGKEKGVFDYFSNVRKFSGEYTQVSFDYPKDFRVTEENSVSGSYIQITDQGKKAVALMKKSEFPEGFSDYEAYSQAQGITPEARNYKDIKGLRWFVHYDNPASPSALIFAAVSGRDLYQIVVAQNQDETARKNMEDVVYNLIETIELAGK